MIGGPTTSRRSAAILRAGPFGSQVGELGFGSNVLSCFGRFASVSSKACRRRTASHPRASHPRTAVGDPVSNSKRTRSRN